MNKKVIAQKPSQKEHLFDLYLYFGLGLSSSIANFSSMIRIEANNLTKKFGHHVVFEEFSHPFENGVYGIAGNNGAGKSTLLKCLARLLLPSRGDITWQFNEQVLEVDQCKRKMGYAAPYVNLYSEFTARENLEFIGQLRQLDPSALQYRYWLDELQVIPLLDIPFGSLSTGQQQRVKLAAALMYEPDFLFLDEPGSNLDEQGRNLVEQISHEWTRPNRLLVIASNIPDELSLCDHIISIDDY